jgi:hypothetical protein
VKIPVPSRVGKIALPAVRIPAFSRAVTPAQPAVRIQAPARAVKMVQPKVVGGGGDGGDGLLDGIVDDAAV